MTRKRHGRVSKGALGVIRSNATRRCEDANRLGLTWRSRPATLRDRDFAALERNLQGVVRAGRKIERLLFGRPKKPESSAYNYVGREV